MLVGKQWALRINERFYVKKSDRSFGLRGDSVPTG